MLPLLYALFFLSGAAGLMYESVWARYLGLFVGHEAYAQVLVLVIFLGGMSVGAMLVARRSEDVKDPLRSYAIIEGAVGVLGLVFHVAFTSSTAWAYAHGFPALGAGPGAALLKWGLAALLILPQSVLLGATFPLMSAGVLRRVRHAPGRVLGWLYFTNSLGAAIGVLVAGFAIVNLLGLPGVLYTAATLNLLVAAGAWLVSRRIPAAASSVDAAPVPAQQLQFDHPPLERVLLASAFLTAVASFCYEIDWIRMLSLVLGSGTHSFEVMLSAFILGLALGAFWIRNRVDRFQRPAHTLVRIQVVMGLLAVATLPVYAASFSWMAWLQEALSASAEGYVLFTIGRYGLALAVMLPATFCAGMTLPLITRMLLVSRGSEAAIGQVYGFNTLGSIVGAMLAALVLLPMLGLKGLLLLAGAIDVSVGALILYGVRERSRVAFLFPIGAAVALFAVGAFPLDRSLLVSGVFRGRGYGLIGRQHVDYYADGRTATVAVTRGPGAFLALSTNGKVDASLSEDSQLKCDPKSAPRQVENDEVTQLLTGMLPLAYLTGPADAAVIGIGSGISTHTLLASPLLRSVTTIEIEPRMVDGARLFAPANRRTFDDARSRIVIGDARAVFAQSNRRFDLIISEPSNPWVSGVSSLFTTEFYRRVSSQLSPSGVFAQWLQTYDLDGLSVLRVLRAIDDVFPDWQIHQVGADDILIVATQAPALPTPRWQDVATLPSIVSDLCGVIPLDAAGLEATVLADRALLTAVVHRIGAPNSDYHPLLDLAAERRRFEDQDADALLELGDRSFNFVRQLMNRPQSPVPTKRATFAGIRRSNERQAQTWQSAQGTDTAPSPALSRVQYEWRRWQQGILAKNAPSDWRSWVAEFQSVSHIRHAGTAGWADADFFDQALTFATTHRAPAIVVDVIRFRRATQGWDAIEALAAAERLGDRGLDLAEWIPVRDVLDGAVIAAASLGQPATAKVWLELFGRRAERAPDDIMQLLLIGLTEGPVAGSAALARSP